MSTYDRHGSFFSWKGQDYFICNDQSHSQHAYFRDCCIAKVKYDDEGHILPLVIDEHGVDAIDDHSSPRKSETSMAKTDSLKSLFSLVEMLVSIAILAILISLLSPALRDMVHKSELIHCKSNLSKMAPAMAFYVGDHGEYAGDDYSIEDQLSIGVGAAIWRSEDLPYYMGGPDVSQSRVGSSNHLYEANALQAISDWHSTGVLSCPTAKNIESLNGRRNIHNFGWKFMGTFALNYVMSPGRYGDIYRTIRFPSDIEIPSQFAMGFDASTIIRSGNWFAFGPTARGSDRFYPLFPHRGTNETENNYGIMYNSGESNVLFGDYHIGQFSPWDEPLAPIGVIHKNRETLESKHFWTGNSEGRQTNP
jgi:hypothetical protein